MGGALMVALEELSNERLRELETSSRVKYMVAPDLPAFRAAMRTYESIVDEVARRERGTTYPQDRPPFE